MPLCVGHHVGFDPEPRSLGFFGHSLHLLLFLHIPVPVHVAILSLLGLDVQLFDHWARWRLLFRYIGAQAVAIRVVLLTGPVLDIRRDQWVLQVLAERTLDALIPRRFLNHIAPVVILPARILLFLLFERLEAFTIKVLGVAGQAQVRIIEWLIAVYVSTALSISHQLICVFQAEKRHLLTAWRRQIHVRLWAQIIVKHRENLLPIVKLFVIGLLFKFICILV